MQIPKRVAALLGSYAHIWYLEGKLKVVGDQLALTEKALELACEEIDKIVVFDAEFLESDSFYDYYLKKAKEMIKSE